MSPSEPNHQLETLLQYLKHARGFDFTGYKRASLARRIRKRMQAVDIDDYRDYQDFLEVHPNEFTALFNTILINVTSFFRDPESWVYLENEIIPKIVDHAHDPDSIRVWCAGVASGEEAYTAAILLAKVLGEKEFRERVKIYATDIDEEALSQARQASYNHQAIENIPEDILEEYFEKSGGRYTFRQDLRRSVIFGRHDLIQDAPISRIDLLICRNVLMYLNSETQAKVLARLHFATRDSGYLFLGKAEMLLTQSNLFLPVDLKLRVFRKVARVSLRDSILLLGQPNHDEEAPSNNPNPIQLRDAAFNTYHDAQIVVDQNNNLTLVNDAARRIFGLGRADLGHPFSELEISYRPVSLRAALDEARAKESSITLKEVEFREAENKTTFFNVQVRPLFDDSHQFFLGYSVTFLDITESHHLQKKLEQSNQELETAMEELQSTNEELETTNEELQSTIEELETTNEELQSTNEELETMNEELQSTNQELEAVNIELRLRNQAYDQVNAFLESILGSLRAGVIVLDQDLNIQVWNKNSEDLWGARGKEVLRQNFFTLDIGLPVEKLKKPIRSVLSGEKDSEIAVLDSHNRKGREFECRVTVTPLNMDSDMDLTSGVILTMENNEEYK